MNSNHNEYDRSMFELNFRQTEIYQKLIKDFKVIDFEKLWNWRPCTPREMSGASICTAAPFYYLEYLVDANPSEIYDLGCGWNMFKKYIPNVIGIGAELPDSGGFYGDIHDIVDDGFVQGHQDFFESVFSINALHFHPMSDLRKIVDDFISMIKPGGIGFLALNAQKMIDRDTEKFRAFSSSDLDRYIRDELGAIHVNWLVFDVDLSVLDEYMNGNIRLVMRKGDSNA